MKYRLNSGSKLPTAACAYNMQTTALGWIEQARVALVKFWWMRIVVKVKTITVTYRSHTLNAHESVINDAQTNRVCALSEHWSSYFCLNTVLYIHIAVKINVQQVFYNECSLKKHVLEKFVKISGVYLHIRASDAPLSLVLTEFTDDIAEFPHIQLLHFSFVFLFWCV